MPYIAGRGRYARETYPSPPSAPSSSGPTGPTGSSGSTGPAGSPTASLGPFGYDQVIETNTASNNAYAGTGGLEVMRDASANPMQVVLTGLTPGAVLRCTYSLNVLGAATPPDGGTTGAWIAVSFDDPVGAYPTGWFNVNDSSTEAKVVQDNEAPDPPLVNATLTQTCYFAVPAGKTRATIRVRSAVDGRGDPAITMTYVGLDSSPFLTVGGDSGLFASCSLEVWQIPAALVQQLGPSTLVAANLP